MLDHYYIFTKVPHILLQGQDLEMKQVTLLVFYLPKFSYISRDSCSGVWEMWSLAGQSSVQLNLVLSAMSFKGQQGNVNTL